jgi:hypothetical protein
MEISCKTAKQTLFVMSRTEERQTTQLLGCVPKINPLPLAPTDLRDMELPDYWRTTTNFFLDPGLVEYIPELPSTLEKLKISENRLREVPNFPESLVFIELDNNRLETIPPLPPKVVKFAIHNNFLETIPGPLPKTLARFSAKRNLLSSLPDFVETRVVSVGVSFNNLSSLPKFPNTLRNLGCSNNNITVIDNLPFRLEILNCSNNPLEVLRIENLITLRVLLANNCKLKEIPVLPEVEGNNNNDDDRNREINNQEGGASQKGGRYFQRYHFDGNPLSPNFQIIYRRYIEDEISEAGFRRQVLAEHKRILAERKKTLGSTVQVLKPAVLSKRELTPAERVFGNYGPGDLIASFITGKPGTIEAQRLALVKNQEKLWAVPEGIANTARRRLADIAVRGSDLPREEGAPNILKERAKLYVSRGNIAEAEDRFDKELEQIAEREENNNNNNDDDDDANNANGEEQNQEIRVGNENEGEALGVAMLEAQRNFDREEQDAAINRWNYEEQQDGGKKHRRRLTPRKRKSSRQTRRH